MLEFLHESLHRSRPCSLRKEGEFVHVLLNLGLRLSLVDDADENGLFLCQGILLYLDQMSGFVPKILPEESSVQQRLNPSAKSL